MPGVTDNRNDLSPKRTRPDTTRSHS